MQKLSCKLNSTQDYQVKVDSKNKLLGAVETNRLICFYSLARLLNFLLRTFVLLSECGA